jgi:hypothetical protein
MSQRRQEEFVDVLRQGVFSLLWLHHLGQRALRVGRAAGKHYEVEEIYEEQQDENGPLQRGQLGGVLLELGLGAAHKASNILVQGEVVRAAEWEWWLQGIGPR